MELRLLGPVELWVAGAPADLGPMKRRLVVAALAVDAGRPVPLETLIDRLWEQAPPAKARQVLYAHLSRIRSALASDEGIRLARRSSGYLLEADLDLVDLHRFDRLLAAARGRDDTAKAALLRKALGQWRGTPLAGLAGDWVVRLRERLVRQRLDAAAQWADAELRLGHPEPVLAELSAMTAEHPLAEHLVDAYLRALNQSGRGAEALEVFAATRRQLVEELGSEPGSRLRQTHEEILRGDPPAPAPVKSMAGGPVPAQLPADVITFVGRTQQLARLDELAARAAGPTVVLFGPAGVGKTSLGAHWAHIALHRFPDGQLYADLGGPGRQRSTVDVLSSFVRALGVAADAVPVDEQELVALYRSLLAGRRTLVLLDNAPDAGAVRPLLPGTSPSMALVTSRDPLRGLQALHDVAALHVGTLESAEATQLMRQLLRQHGIGAADEQLAELADLCACLPLALRIAAANLADRGTIGLAGYLRELRTDRFGQLRVDGDEQVAVRAVFEVAFAQLAEATREVFGLLGAAPVRDLARPAVAALAGRPDVEVAEHLARLVRSGLCDQAPGRRVQLHDLLRRFAVELFPDRPNAALHRLYSHYHRTALAAAATAVHAVTRIEHDPPAPGAAPLAFDDADAAAAWLDAELANLVAVTDAAAESPSRRLAWQLADALRDHFWIRRYGPEWLAIGAGAVAASRATDDPAAEAASSNNLGIANWSLSRYDEAIGLFTAALRAGERVGDLAVIAAVRSNLAGVYREVGDLAEAAELCRTAIAAFEQLERPLGATNARITLGGIAEDMGELGEALRHGELALHQYRELDRPDGQGSALLLISNASRRTGDLRRAAKTAEEALGVFCRIGARQGEACALQTLAAVHLDSHDPDTAAPLAWDALSIARDTSNAELEAQVRTNLADIDAQRGDHQAALDGYAEALDLACRHRLRLTELAALIGRAASSSELGKHRAALAAADEAVELADRHGYRLAAACARSVAASAHAATGDAERGIDLARRALAVHEASGCVPWRDRTRRTLAALGA